MLNWLTSLFSNPVADLKAAWKWLTGAISAVYSYFDGLISQIDNGLNWLSQHVTQYVNDIDNVLGSLGNGIYWVIHTGIPDAIRWAQNEIAKAYNYSLGLYHAALNELNKLIQWAQSELDKLAQWAIKNIWDPLRSGIQRVIRWIENEGTFVYYLLTHPDKLALLLGKYILASWMALASKYGKIVARWILHNALSDGAWLANFLENVISSLL